MSHSILLVDDHVHILRVMQKNLSSNGYLTETAHNGADAWEKLQQQAFDAIVSDFEMPLLNGEELIQRVHALYQPPPLIVMVTGKPDAALQAKIENYPNTQFQTKPISLSLLKGIFATYFAEFDEK